MDGFFDNYLSAYGDYTYAVTPYLHILRHLPELQQKLRIVVGYFQNSCTLSFMVLISYPDLIAFEAHHKLSRLYRKFGSSFDAGNPRAVYWLPRDKSGNFFRTSQKEPISQLQIFELIYGPLVLRIFGAPMVVRPTYSLTFPRFEQPKFPRETRQKRKGNCYQLSS